MSRINKFTFIAGEPKNPDISLDDFMESFLKEFPGDMNNIIWSSNVFQTHFKFDLTCDKTSKSALVFLRSHFQAFYDETLHRISPEHAREISVELDNRFELRHSDPKGGTELLSPAP